MPCPPPGDLPNPGIEPGFPTLQVDSLPAELPGKPGPTSGICHYLEAGEEREACKKSTTRCEVGGKQKYVSHELREVGEWAGNC